MKRSALILAALAMATVFAGTIGTSGAASCGDGGTGRDASDKFGSCEENDGSVKCGTGTDISTLATVIAKNEGNTQGVQGCASDDDGLPIAGRVGAYRDNNNVTVFVDGGDKKNPGGAGGWQRYDVRGGDTAKLVCARRGTGGTYYTGSGGGNGSSNPDGSVNHSVGSGGPGTCQ